MFVVFYTVNLYMWIYELFHIQLSLCHAYGSVESMYICNELERKWKKAVGHLKYCSDIYLEGLRKGMKNLWH